MKTRERVTCNILSILRRQLVDRDQGLGARLDLGRLRVKGLELENLLAISNGFIL